jgi:hypothetical protein
MKTSLSAANLTSESRARDAPPRLDQTLAVSRRPAPVTAPERRAGRIVAETVNRLN